MNSSHTAELGLVAAPKEKGDPIEVLTLLGKGDSASCLIPAEEFFKNIEIPAPLKKGDKLKLDLKIADVFSKDQYDAKVAEMEAQKNAAASLPGINYMRDHNLAGIPMPGGMYYVIDKQGTGAQPTTGKKVKVNYSGTLLDGTPFDSSLDPGREPFEFTIGQHQVIAGWDQGIPMFKVGGKGKLIIPPSMGYGEGGQGKIPPSSWLVFDIEVLGVSDPAPNHQTLQMK
jgi:FKBP-type peptidyl-prolyl cis-trans isomerase